MTEYGRRTLVLLGVSGVGRRTLKSMLLAQLPNRFATVVPCEFWTSYRLAAECKPMMAPACRHVASAARRRAARPRVYVRNQRGNARNDQTKCGRRMGRTQVADFRRLWCRDFMPLFIEAICMQPRSSRFGMLCARVACASSIAPLRRSRICTTANSCRTSSQLRRLHSTNSDKCAQYAKMEASAATRRFRQLAATKSCARPSRRTQS